jgi:hypothetical protein
MMNETVRKRKAQVADSEEISDSVETPTPALGLVPVAGDIMSTPLDLFLQKFQAQPAGTLEAWKKYLDKAKGITDFVMVKTSSAQKADCDAVFNMLTDDYLNEQLGGLGLDLTGLKKALNDDELREFCSTSWLQYIHLNVILACTSIGTVYEKLKEIREQLKFFSTLSNKTEVGTQTAEREKEYAVSDKEYLIMMEGVHIPSPSKP